MLVPDFTFLALVFHYLWLSKRKHYIQVFITLVKIPNFSNINYHKSFYDTQGSGAVKFRSSNFIRPPF